MSNEKLIQAINIVLTEQLASLSLLQRSMLISYSEAEKCLDFMEKAGIVGKYRGPSPRFVLVEKKKKF